MAEKSDWASILSAFLIGVASAVQVGRIAPVATLLQNDLRLDLLAIGWLVSLITAASAVLGLAAGYWVVRAGLRRSLIVGALVIGVSALVSAGAAAVPVLIGARIIEGIGYLFVVVAAPTLIAREAAPKDTAGALALWGTFFTFGLSLAAFAGGALVDPLGWRGWFVVSAGLILLSVGLAFLSIPQDTRSEDTPTDLRRTFTDIPKAAWLLGAAFLGVTLLALSILSLLPTFLVQEHGLTPSAAGGTTGGVALASIAGSLCYGLLAHRVPEAGIATLAAGALVAATVPTFAEGAMLDQIIPFAAAAVFMSGLLVAQTFAAVPRVAGASHLVGPSNGLVAQLGSVGALTGPPLIGALVASAGWAAVPVVAAAFAATFLLLFLLALRAQPAQSPETPA
ncbi:MAG: MFS transporter [Pseudomonadota bacterium]